MAKKELTTQPPAPEQPDHMPALMRALTTDENAGKGGSYVFDPATGKRTPVVDAPSPAVAEPPQPEQEI